MFGEYKFKVLNVLKDAIGYENGVSIDELTKKVYGVDSIINRIKIRSIIRSLRNRDGLFIYSIELVGEKGSKKRYCHLNNEKEFQQVIDDYMRKADGYIKTIKLLREGEIIKVEPEKIKELIIEYANKKRKYKRNPTKS